MSEVILISLEFRHASNIFAGVKSVELRTRIPRVESGATVWIYSKAPSRAVVGYAEVTSVVTGSPTALWERFKGRVGISRAEFRSYFHGRSIGAAIELSGCESLRLPISLDQLRALDAAFHPPQFFSRLREGSEVAKALSRAQKAGQDG